MLSKSSRTRLLASCVLAIALACNLKVPAQTTPTSHNLTFSNVTETIDAAGRRIFVANVRGDLQGVLTLAVVLGPGGTVTSGEWALNLSYIELGPPSSDGDGDPVETLVQRGTIKGSVSSGYAVVGNDGYATDLSNVQLNITGATLEFASVVAGAGNVLGSSMNQQAASSGYFTLTF